MKVSFFLAQIFLGNAKNDVRWPKEREFSWMQEGPELSSEEFISLKEQLKPLSGIYHSSCGLFIFGKVNLCMTVKRFHTGSFFLTCTP